MSYAPDALAARPIVLTVKPGHTAPIGGRVVDPDGRPIAGGTVRLWREVRHKDGRPIVVDPLVQANGSALLHTDAQGRYRTTRRFPVDFAYVAEAWAPGRPPVRSAAITPGDRDREFPPIVLRRLRTIEGRVVDRQGRPVAGALVFQSGDGPMRTEALADQDGRFALPRRARRARDRPRPQGRIPRPLPAGQRRRGVDPRSRWPASDEAPIAAYKTLPPALPADEEKALARRLVQPEAGRVLARGDDQEKFVFLTNLAAFDPADALERLEAARFADPDDVDSIRIAAAEALARENLDEGLAVVETLKTPEQRAQGYLAVLQARARPRAGPRPAGPRPGDRQRAIAEQRAAEDLPAGTDRRPAARPGRDRAGEAPDPRGRGAGTEDAPGRALAYRLADFAGLMLRVDPAAALPAFEELRRQADGGQVTVRRLRLRSALWPGRLPLRGTQSGRGRAPAAPALVHPGAPGEHVRRGRLRADGPRRPAARPQARRPDHRGRAGPQGVCPRPDGRGDRHPTGPRP